VIAKTVRNTGYKEVMIKLDDLSDNGDFFKYQRQVCPNENQVASHLVIDKRIKKFGEDYRFETKANPEKTLRNRKEDNTELARKKNV